MTVPAGTRAGIVARLAAAGCVNPADEADLLLAAAANRRVLDGWVREREQGVPLAWIVGLTRFGGHQLRVDRGVYVPRAHSEELARRAAAALASSPGKRAADLCTGCGAVAAHLAVAVPGAIVVGVDLDPVAAGCARRNHVAVVVGDGGRPLRSGTFDVVTAVAPYVPSAALALLPADVQRYEPRRALDGGHDGLVVVRQLIRSAARLLRPGGQVLLEVGGDEEPLVTPVLAGTGFVDISAWRDEDGQVRGVAAARPAAGC